MVGTRQLERVLSHAAEAGAKVVLVGDLKQLQAIEAGAASARSTSARRRGNRRSAPPAGGLAAGRHARSRDGRTGTALDAYRSHGMVHEARTREQARADLIERWDRDRQAAPEHSRIILTHTNDEVRALNEAARERMRAAAILAMRWADGRARRAQLRHRGPRHVPAERTQPWREERHARYHRTGQRAVHGGADRRRPIRSLRPQGLYRIDHGYAATIYKAQGVTVDRVHVLATPGLDAHGRYVALSRHREGMELHYGRDDFAGQGRLLRTLSRERAKDMASDYERADPVQSYAERRGITFRERVAEIVRKVVPEKLRDMFDGLRSPGDAPGPDGGRRPERGAPRKGKERYGSRAAPNQDAGKEGGGTPGKGIASRAYPSARAPCPRRGCDLRGAGDGRRGNSWSR